MPPLSTLTVQMQVNADQAITQLNVFQTTVNNFGNAFKGVSTKTVAAGTIMANALVGVFNKAVGAIEGLIGFLGSTVAKAIDLSAKFNNALIGLGDVGAAFGHTFDTVTAAARDLSKDGLLPLKDSATGLKNLLMSGFGLKESVDIMKVFKDSAVFARQEALSYGDAIRTATEGIKNMRSQTIDNVGITKNVSVIMREAGFQMADLTDKTKGAAARQAFYNGILREGAAFAGAAARALNTYTGAMIAMSTSYDTMLALLGDFVTKNKAVQLVLLFIADTMRDLTAWLAKGGKGFFFVADAAEFMVRVLIGVVGVIDLVQWAFVKFMQANQIVVSAIQTGLIELIKTTLQFLTAMQHAFEGQIGFEAFTKKIDDARNSLADTEINLIMAQREGAQTTADMVKQSEAWSAGTVTLQKKLFALADEIHAHRGEVVDLGEQTRKASTHFDAFAGAVDKAGKKVKEKIDTFRELADLVRKQGDTGGMADALDQVSATLPKFKNGMEAARDAMWGYKEVKIAVEMVQAIGGAAEVANLTGKEIREVYKATGMALAVFRNLGVTAPTALQSAFKEAEQLVGEMDNVKDSVKRVEKQVLDMISSMDMTDIKVIPIAEMFDWNKAKQQAGVLRGDIEQEMQKLAHSLNPIFRDVFLGLPKIMGEALSRGDNIFAAAGTFLADTFLKSYNDRLKAAQKEGKPGTSGLTGGEKLMGLAGAGIGGFMGGYGMGAQQGTAVGAIGGAASGAMTGFMVGGPVGAAVGGIAGLIGGIFGGKKKAKEERAQLAQMKQDLLDTYGGMENLRKVADKVGINIDAAFNAKKPAQFKTEIDKLNKALDEQKKKLEALNGAMKGINDRAKVFGDRFQKIYEATLPAADAKPGAKDTKEQTAAKQQLQSLAQASEAEFGRIGVMVQGTFGAVVKETGNAIEAIQQMGPAFQVLDDGVNKFGIHSTAVIDNLLASFHMVTDEALKPFFDAIVADGEVLKGLFDAKALGVDTFQVIAADIGAQIQGIVDHGGDMAKTLALSQPVLQTLWEASQQYGAVTDENTAKILKQAEEQGLVGAQFKDINEKILDVLLAIGQVLGADLPQYFNDLKKPADDAATSIEDSFKKIDIQPIEVPYKFKQEGGGLPSGNSGTTTGTGASATVAVPAMAAGGIVRRPTLALIGEAGPEAVIPLSGSTLGVAPSNYETSIYLDGEKIARSSARRIPRLMRTLGVGH